MEDGEWIREETRRLAGKGIRRIAGWRNVKQAAPTLRCHATGMRRRNHSMPRPCGIRHFSDGHRQEEHPSSFFAILAIFCGDTALVAVRRAGKHIHFLPKINRNAFPSTIYIQRRAICNQGRSSLVKVNQGIFEPPCPPIPGQSCLVAPAGQFWNRFPQFLTNFGD
jgi:hypothetical protein